MYYSLYIGKTRSLSRQYVRREAPGNEESCNSEEVHDQSMQNISLYLIIKTTLG